MVKVHAVGGPQKLKVYAGRREREGQERAKDEGWTREGEGAKGERGCNRGGKGLERKQETRPEVWTP